MRKIKLVVIPALSLIFLSCTSTFSRAMMRGDARVDDYKYFPERKISAGREVREISCEPDVFYADRLAALLGTNDLQSFIDKTKTQALLVLKGNKLIFEAYGKDYSRESIVTSFSVAKSFVSVMIGELIEQGKIKSVEQPVTDFIPELGERDKRFSRIRLCDLLSMTSGISYSELTFDDTKTYYAPDLRTLATTKTKIAEPPARHFLYNNYNPLLLGVVIERASGTKVSSYLQENIWKPMGAEFDASWSLDSESSGFEKMESGLNARAIDFARFGCMYRDGGKVNGRQIISGSWIHASISDHHSDQPDFYKDDFGCKLKNAEQGGYYSYFWYVLKREPPMHNDFFAAGNKSQIIYVSPESELVIVRFGEKDGIDFWKWISSFYNLATQTINTGRN